MHDECAWIGALSTIVLGLALHAQVPPNGWRDAEPVIRTVAAQLSLHQLSVTFECPGDPQVPGCENGPPDRGSAAAIESGAAWRG
jgi:hypothetical protein